MAADVAFWILAVVGVGAALGVVLIRDIFRAALFLVLCFFTVAGIYVTLQADFLAAVQVLVYIGAVAVLLIFAVMLTREAQRGSPSNRLRIPVLLFALVLLGTMIFTMVGTEWSVPIGVLSNTSLETLGESGSGLTASLAEMLFSEDGFILPLEIAGLMLLAAVIGAIVIMREK
ncbi:MAG: NADH-quinone oxidoreductase subunit L [Dehalococcoidia bacterium]|nr:MAG: NADH-quinone oxidoreductase subunit L [Dehalococcoidia bacterium]